MALWLIRAGRDGQREALALQEQIAVIGWEELPDLGNVQERKQLADLLQSKFQDRKPKTLINWQSQIWAFLHTIVSNDLVVLPLKTRPSVALGRVAGPYVYRRDLGSDPYHTRRVDWLKEVPRSAFDEDLRYSFSALMTVCQIQRNQAEDRIKGLISGNPPQPPRSQDDSDAKMTDKQAPIDLEQAADDGIRDSIGKRFKGHKLSNLVAAILAALGYQVQESPEGPDGGIDIIAGHGLLGFEQPRLAVQVKSGDSPADVKVVRELQGAMKNFGATQGLFVAWGGYTPAVMKESRRSFFELRLWNSNDLLRMIQAHYEALPPTIQTELPLKRIWTLMPSEE